MLEELVISSEFMRLTDIPSSKASYSVSALLQREKCQQLLNEIAQNYKIDSPLVAASLFSKRYVYSLVVSTLWSMSINNQGLPINIENCCIEFVNERGKWLPYLRLINKEVSKPGAGRDIWREQLLIRLVADHLTPLWTQLHEVTGISKLILWENLAIYVYWLYQLKLKETHLTIEQRNQAETDYQALVFALPAYHFGEQMQPLRRLLKGLSPEQRQRKTCCLSYLTDAEKKTCTICPRRRIKQQLPKKQSSI